MSFCKHFSYEKRVFVVMLKSVIYSCDPYFLPFYTISAHNFDYFIGFVARNGNQCAMVMKGYLSDLVTPESANLGQGADNVAF